MRLRVNYLKASFKTDEPSRDFVSEWFVSHGQLYTGVLPECNHVKITLMGNGCKHVNVTGVRTVQELDDIYNVYTHHAHVKPLSYPKIDSISASCKINRMCMLNFDQYRTNLADSNFHVSDHPKFSGITIRKSSDPRKVITLFPSGSINFIGYKHFNQVKHVCEEVINCIVKCVNCCLDFN